MATIFFALLVLADRISTPYDWYWGFLLLAIEGPGYLNAWRLWALSFRER
mgnify:CR=1 FL=1